MGVTAGLKNSFEEKGELAKRQTNKRAIQ